MPIIKVENLVFEYPYFRALRDVSFTIEPQTITALVGPNGAGKSTLLRCLAALDEPFSGNILIDGIDTKKDPRLVHKKIGYLSDFFGTYDDLTVLQCLTYIAWSQEIYGKEAQERVEEVANQLRIANLLGQKAHSLSRGQRQRMAICQAIIHQPKILLLDEPASGLDPEARIELSELLVKMKNQGMTIVVSSHILAELEDYSTNMIVLRDGKIEKQVGFGYGQNQHNQNLEITIKFTEKLSLEQLEKIKQHHLFAVHQFDVKDNFLEFSAQISDYQQVEFLQYLISQKLPVCGFWADKKSLEKIYLEGKNEGK